MMKASKRCSPDLEVEGAVDTILLCSKDGGKVFSHGDWRSRGPASWPGATESTYKEYYDWGLTGTRTTGWCSDLLELDQQDCATDKA